MRVLFLGEGDLSGPARYLAAVLKAAKISFDHRPDRARIPKSWRAKGYDAVILSDYRYRSFTPCAREWLTESVTRGTGLLMIGGWASFTGLVGGYAGTSIERMLPVRCKPGDDRMNYASGSLVVKAASHPVTHGISSVGSPVVCGYHQVRVRRGAQVVMGLQDVKPGHRGLHLGKPHPLLVLGTYGKARTGAFLTDCAPHWAGGLVDWGKKRRRIALCSQIHVEVGDRYLSFFGRLVRWISKSDSI